MVHRVFVLGLSFALFTLQPTMGGAAVITQTFSDAAVTVAGPIAEFYDYTQASLATWTAPADFDAGTYVNTNGTDVAGSIVLNRIGPVGVLAPSAITWWDTTWNNRRCFALDHTDVAATGVTEYQLRLDFPLEALITAGLVQADTADLRAIGADGITSLPLWVDDTIPDTIWVQMDTIAAGAVTDLCLYYGYNAGTATSPVNHSEAAVFSYTSAVPVYYTVSDRYGPPGTAINVVSYTDANEVTRSGGPTVALAAAGDRTTFDAIGNTAASVFSVLGPISADGSGDGYDTLVPISYAGSRFVAPIGRDAQQFSFVAPFGAAVVELFDGATSVATFTVPAGTPYTHIADDIAPGNTAIIESDVPVLVTHTSDVLGDSIALYPATAGDLYGVRSTDVLIGYDTDTTLVTVTASDATISGAPGDRGVANTLVGGIAQGGGAADAIQLTADQPIGALAHEDGDGNESAVFLPRGELNSRYWIPSDSQYIAFSCPTESSAPLDLTVTAPGVPSRAVTCAGGPTVAWAADTADLAVTATRGTEVTTVNGEPFFAYYETLAADDQTNLLGMKQGRQYTWPEPVVAIGGDEGLYETSGTWESATVDTGLGTEIFGSLRIGGATPAATTLQLQVATTVTGTPSSFVGPDGTAASYFTLGNLPSVLDFTHDGDRLLRVRAEFVTTDPIASTPRLDLIGVDHHLVALDRSLSGSPVIGVATTIDPVITTSYLLRIKTTDAAITGSEATAMYRGDTNLVNLTEETVRFVNAGLGIDSVQQSITLPTEPPVPFDPTQPHSLVIDHAATASGVTEIAFAWQLDYQAGGSVFFETDFMVEVTAP
ncbi:MAG: hypothetical protein U9N84_11235 [Actinomycetota bacterium]|nr:hypothetical protein [Actinomycetota bacterium]